jgi:hypothetical protein
VGINRKIVASLLGSAFGILVLLTGPGATNSAADPCDMNWCSSTQSSSMVTASGLNGDDDTNW